MHNTSRYSHCAISAANFFLMRFADADAYSSYNEHPVHVAFVRNRWDGEVSNFQELDLVALNGDHV
jgi:hypothetical protein